MEQSSSVDEFSQAVCANRIAPAQHLFPFIWLRCTCQRVGRRVVDRGFDRRAPTDYNRVTLEEELDSQDSKIESRHIDIA